ncbi:MAG: DMT family transporter [Cytophagales bacterium]|nr:DMT family transporter [Bernardetiaceae bacterium]MDW8205918.1 DMT family transporter [Cytophagales bacterium]
MLYRIQATVQKLDLRQVAGAALIMTGAVGFASKAIIAKLMYRYEVDTTSMLALRMLFALPFFMGVIAYNYRRVPFSSFSTQDKLLIPLMAFIGYYLSSLFDFWGLQYVSAGLERLILFIYPTIVVVISAIWFKKPILKQHYYALGLTYLGIAIALSTDFSATGRYFWWGAGLIFMAAFTYSIYLIVSGRLIPRIGSVVYISYIMFFATIPVFIQYFIKNPGSLWRFDAAVYQLNIWMAIVATVAPAVMTSEGIRLIGASNAAIVGSIGPIATIFLAYVLLGEPFSFWQMLGTLFVLTGVLIITLRKKETTTPKQETGSEEAPTMDM